MATPPAAASPTPHSSQFQLALHGVPGIVARLRALKGDGASRIISQSIDRGLKSARTEIVRELRGTVPGVPRSELLSRITLRKGPVPEEATLRLVGAGKHGRGFLRPRHLGLPMRKAKAEVAWSADGQREAPPRAFVMSPLGGGRFAGVDSPEFDKKRALVWQREGARRDGIRRVNEPFTVGMLLQRSGRLERARGLIVARVASEMQRRLDVELRRK